MAKFRGLVQGARGQATRLGHASSGMTVEAQSWEGKVVTSLREECGKIWANVALREHMGHGARVILYDGPVDCTDNYSTDLK